MTPLPTVTRLLFAVMLVMISLTALASDDAPVVWVDHDAALAGKQIGTVLPVTDDSGQHIPQTRLQEVHDALVETLKQQGVLLSKTDPTPQDDSLVAKVGIISFKTGSAAGRWLGFGAGAAKCTMRAQLLDPHDSVVAEVIETRVVDTGGFFTIGTDSTFHIDLAKSVADALARILKPDGAKQ